MNRCRATWRGFGGHRPDNPMSPANLGRVCPGPDTENAYEVTVRVAGRTPWTTTVSAPREGLARTRAIVAYTHSDAPDLRGELVEYDVTLKEQQ